MSVSLMDINNEPTVTTEIAYRFLWVCLCEQKWSSLILSHFTILSHTCFLMKCYILTQIIGEEGVKIQEWIKDLDFH